MKNNDFLKQYVDGIKTSGANGRMAYKDNKIVSYDTVICELDREKKVAAFNDRKYSSTTSRMQGYLLYLLKCAGYDVIKYNGDDANIWDRWEARNKKVTIDSVPTI